MVENTETNKTTDRISQDELDSYKQEIQKLNQEIKVLKTKEKHLEHQVQLEQHRATQSLKKYNTLAQSKMGKLTLKYWAWKKRKKREGILARLAHWFINVFSCKKADRVLLNDVAQAESTVQAAQKKQAEKQPAPQTTMPMHAEKPAAPQVMTPEQENWIEGYTDKIAMIHDSNGCRYYKKLNYRIGLVCDEFFLDSIDAAADFVFLTPENWQEEVEKGLDAMLFVSAWRGLHNEWRGLAALTNRTTNPRRMIALELLERCRERGIPSVFYSKEDPPSYELFLDYARSCDYIFTSASECVPYYEKECERDHVGAVSFGINPCLHNPIGFRSAEKEDTVLFSGSWMTKFPERCADLAVLFDGILDSGHGLQIIDRNYPENRNYAFPDKYFPYTSPALPHDQLQKVHKLFDWAININSVKGSETMFANRAFELQANGVLMMSNSSVGINNILPTIHLVHDSSEVAGILGCMTDEERYERQIMGIRSVMTNHTCFDRIAQLLAPTGLDTAQPSRKILVFAEKMTDAVLASFERQTYQEKELMIAESVTEEVLAQYDMVTWFDSEAEYGTFYLEDLANGFKYTSCDYITKDAWYEGAVLHRGVEHDYVSHMRSKYRTLFWTEAFPAGDLLNMPVSQALPNGYSIDHFNYNAAPVVEEKPQREYLLSVIVPVYNNGLHLYGKCFSSLRRSSMFDDMEIILVDDGSTDEYTLKIEDHLLKSYKNVRSYRFEKGGSGSASRPRNKGVEMATAKYIAFLDPDDETVCDGFFKLYDAAVKNNCDLTLGERYKCDTTYRSMKYYASIVRAAGTDTFENGIGDLLVTTKFIAPGIHCMVIKADLLRQNGLVQVTGAIGEDTLFTWQLLTCAQRIKVLDLPVNIYYAQTAGSVTNELRPSFFRKALLVQQPKAQWLQDNGLMESYMELRHDYYTKFWLMKKLSLASETDAPVCAELLEQILDVYAPYYNNTDSLINQFLDLCKAKDYAGAAALIKEKFPKHIVRPMPTLEEIMAPKKKAAKQKVEYVQKGNAFTFYNITTEEKRTYAWVVLLDNMGYDKVYATPYTSSKEFTFDFTGKEARKYRIRAFIRTDKTTKESDDVAFIEVTSNGEAIVNENLTNAVKKQ